MACKLRICGVEPESIVDGSGIRYVVFVQGCPHNCPGCHNPQAHSFEGGLLVDIDDLFKDIRQNPMLQGVTFSGGEPFCQPEPLAMLARMVHEIGLDVTTYTGFLYEDQLVANDEGVSALLGQTDTLIDGPFDLSQKDLTLRFCGSRNQRVINMGRTRHCGNIILDGVSAVFQQQTT
jgi:anaerobic ribonucleoside-triphosphate reductase activating protein